jgi:hypothetical protein
MARVLKDASSIGRDGSEKDGRHGHRLRQVHPSESMTHISNITNKDRELNIKRASNITSATESKVYS